MDLMTPEENDEFNRIERESATVRQEAIQASLWRKRHRLDEIDLLTNIVRDMSKRITELEQQLVRVDTLPVTTPTNSTKIEAALAQQRTWVGLTDEDVSEIVRGTHNTGSFVRAITAKLKEKNT